VSTELPAGWTIERVRAESGDDEAELLSLERFVVCELFGLTDYCVLQPEVIISFHGLCLVKEEEDWYMGQLDETDGSIICWATYGTDLGEAIQGL
jgi:hypothetical protein